MQSPEKECFINNQDTNTVAGYIPAGTAGAGVVDTDGMSSANIPLSWVTYPSETSQDKTEAEEVPSAGVRSIPGTKRAAMKTWVSSILLGTGKESGGENSSSMLAGTAAAAACDKVAVAADSTFVVVVAAAAAATEGFGDSGHPGTIGRWEQDTSSLNCEKYSRCWSCWFSFVQGKAS